MRLNSLLLEFAAIVSYPPPQKKDIEKRYWSVHTLTDQFITQQLAMLDRVTV